MWQSLVSIDVEDFCVDLNNSVYMPISFYNVCQWKAVIAFWAIPCQFSGSGQVTLSNFP